MTTPIRPTFPACCLGNGCAFTPPCNPPCVTLQGLESIGYVPGSQPTYAPNPQPPVVTPPPVVTTPPVVTPPPSGVRSIFSDDFTGAPLGPLVQRKPGVVGWDVGMSAYVAVQNVTIAGVTKQRLVFQEGTAKTESQACFDGMASEPEVFIEERLYMPSGKESPSIGPKVVCLGAKNDKVIRVWDNGIPGYDNMSLTPPIPFTHKVGASMWGTSAKTDAVTGAEFCFMPKTGAQWDMGEVYGNGASTQQTGVQTHAPYLVDANRGRWVVLRWHFKRATIANNDGVAEHWIDGKLAYSFTGLQNGDIVTTAKGYNGPKGATGYSSGYLRGYANNNFAPGQVEYCDYVRITAGGFAN